MYKGERLNGLTHLLGAILAVPALVTLAVVAALAHDARKVVAFSVYGATLVLLFLCSTLYHSFRGGAKKVFRKLDHCAIYLLIAGTYTPFTLVVLGGAWGWTLFGVVWGLAVVGIVQEAWLARGARLASLAIYLAMGWVGLIAIGPLAARLPEGALTWVVAGGLIYTVGIVFYALDRRYPLAHGIWHVCVLAGGAAHFLAIWKYVA